MMSFLSPINGPWIIDPSMVSRVNVSFRTKGWVDRIPLDLEPHFDINNLTIAQDFFPTEATPFEVPPPLELRLLEEPVAPKFRWKILETLENILKDFPLGITADKLIYFFKKRFGYYPNFAEIEHHNLLSFLLHFPNVITIVESPLNEHLLYRTSWVENVFSPDELFVNAWENIRFLLTKNGYIFSVDKIPEILSKFLDYRADPTDWSYLNKLKYYEYCIKHYENNQMESNVFLTWSKENPQSAILVLPHRSSKESIKYWKMYKKKGSK